MDESRPRHTTFNTQQPLKPPLIERSDLQSPRQRTLYGALTLVFWGLWFYLWLPLLALLAWSLGLQQAFKYMLVLGGYHDVLRLLGIYSLIIVALGGALVVWAVYNIIRFRGVDRRVGVGPVTPLEIGQYFHRDPVSVTRWQGGRRLYVTHNQRGHVANVEVLLDGAPVPT